MDLAINSILVFLLLILPGLIFRRFYYVGEFSKQFNSAAWLNSFYVSILPGIVIQVLTISVFLNYFGTFNNENPLVCNVNLFYSELKSQEIPLYFFSPDFLKYTALYFGLLIAFSALIAQLSWIIVRQLKIDLNFKPLRFHNHWHYYFKGEIVNTKDFGALKKSNNKRVILTECDVLFDLGNGQNKLYKGFITQYSICRNTGDLKSIYLTQARRYKKTKDNKVELIGIPGDIFIIPFDKVLNINLTYIYYDKNTSNLKISINLLLILTLLFLILVFPSKIGVDSLLGKITIRIWLVFFWAFFSLFIRSLYNLKYEKITNKKTHETKNIILGAFVIMSALASIIWFFYIR